MAHIEDRGGKYRARIRLPNYFATATFNDRFTAELWCKYKEDVYNKLRHFDPPKEQLVLLSDAVLMKAEALKKDRADKRTINDVLSLSRYSFKDLMHLSVSELTYDVLLSKAQKLIGSNVVVGGSKKTNTGRITLTSPMTVLKKFKVLSTVLSHLQSLGIPVENHIPKILAYLKASVENLNEKTG